MPICHRCYCVLCTGHKNYLHSVKTTSKTADKSSILISSDDDGLVLLWGIKVHLFYFIIYFDYM